MFLLMSLAFAAAGWLHGHLTSSSAPSHRADPRKRVELSLVWLTAGYFGVVMVVVAVFMLAAPERAAAMLDAEPGNPFQQFAGVMYLSMALMATLAAFFRGVYLVAPVVTWSFYFLAATVVHLVQYHQGGHRGAHAGIAIIAEHALPALLAIALGLRLLVLSRSAGGTGGMLRSQSQGLADRR